MKFLCGKQREDQKLVTVKINPVDVERFIPQPKQLAMNAAQSSTTKFSKATVLLKWISHNLHSTWPLNISEIQVMLLYLVQEMSSREEQNWQTTFQSCSKRWSARKINQPFCLQNVYLKASRFRCTYELCSSATCKWSPKPEKPRLLQISIHRTPVNNVVYIELLRKCPSNYYSSTVGAQIPACLP